MESFKKLAAQYYPITTSQLQAWIQINSIHDEKTIAPRKPYGEGVFKALQFIGKLAEKDGFSVDYCDGHATEISFGTRGPLIGVYAHADVVPVSENWIHPPFGAVIEQEKMYGRGTSDDKGPAIAAYYALKLLKDQGLIQGYQVRLVIGGNEEKGSNCLKYYFHSLHKPYPDFGFTPDGNFPLIYGEKGISNFEVYGDIDLSPIVSIDAGIVANSVIDKAVAVVKKDASLESALKTFDFTYVLAHEDTYSTIEFVGKAAHGSLPELGINAGTALLQFLANHYGHPTLKTIADQYQDFRGVHLGHYYHSTLLHETTLNVGLIRYKNKHFSLVSNYRYPETVNFDKVAKDIEKKTPKPLQYRTLMISPSLLMSPQSPMIQTLLNAYQQETGDRLTPMMTIGGGTYAKEAKNTVAFGSKFPGKEDFIHENDEKIDIEDLHGSIAIYARAIYDLGKLNAVKK
jgi:succinyl-diaminopimelate desuccinylase